MNNLENYMLKSWCFIGKYSQRKFRITKQNSGTFNKFAENGILKGDVLGSRLFGQVVKTPASHISEYLNSSSNSSSST